MADIDIKVAPAFARAEIGSVYVLGWVDGLPDVFGLVRVDDIQAGVAGAIVEEVATDTYTLVSADAFKYKRLTYADGCAVTVPPDVFTDNITLTLRGVFAGCTLEPGAGVTLNIPGGGVEPFTFTEEGATVQLKNVGGNTWDVIGSIQGS